MKKKAQFEELFLNTPYGKMLQYETDILKQERGEYIDPRVKLSYQIYDESLKHRKSFIMKSDELSDYTKTKFIKRAKEIHGDAFNYDTIEFIGKDDIKIFCNKHKGFIQVKRHNHVNTCFEKAPVSCKECYFNTRKSKIDDLKEVFTELWEGHYSYELFTEYKNSTFKIPVICPTHGVFYVTSNLHKNQSVGCGDCYRDKATRKEYLEMLNRVKNKLKK